MCLHEEAKGGKEMGDVKERKRGWVGTGGQEGWYRLVEMDWDGVG